MTQKAQTILEFTILIGIVTVSLFYMGPAIKRGVQSMVKVAADQVGEQNQAEQKVDTNYASEEYRGGGFMSGAYTSMKASSNTTVEEHNYVTKTIYNDRMKIDSTSNTDMGFTGNR